MTGVRLLQLLQLTDSAFPSGAFAHSFGLETAIVEGRVRDETTLEAWLASYLADALGPSEAAAMSLAMRGAAEWRALDAVLFAVTTSREARTALTRIGRALGDAYAAIGLETAGAAAHPALRTAAATIALGIDPAAAIGAYLSNVLAALAGTAARLVPLGQRSIARILWRLRPAIAATVEAAERTASIDELGAWAVAPEIDGLRHRLLGARVFSS